MDTDFANRVAEAPPVLAAPRLWHSLWRQSRRNPRCPDVPRLDGRLALVTGGCRGIGLETSRGLARRGAEVISASRDSGVGKEAARTLSAETGSPMGFSELDLADLTSVERCVEDLATQLGSRRLDVLVANAGLWPTRHRLSAQGHEIAFATNVLGHFALIRGLLARDLLAEDARVVILTGDIYILSKECTPDFRYRTARGCQLAYCRTKLGNLWVTNMLASRNPRLRVLAVHPGVIASELSGGTDGLVGAFKRRFLLSTEAGAQTSLYCATAQGLESGSYYHNTLGRMQLRVDDPAADQWKATALWETLDRLAPIG